MQYTGFWRRFASFWLDALIFLPFAALALWGNEQSRLFQVYWLVPGAMIGLWFNVYLVQKFGGTPGKLLLKIKITRTNGEDVGFKEAMLRFSVTFLLSMALSAAMIIVVTKMSDVEYFSMDWQKRAEYMVDHAPGWYNLVNFAMNIWIWSEFMVMLTNEKRRALHDFMAGTVVINSEALDRPNQIENTPCSSEAND
ncbi:MAG: RDD family protein [Candidatus Rifleibacteriota bacterium]